MIFVFPYGVLCGVLLRQSRQVKSEARTLSFKDFNCLAVGCNSLSGQADSNYSKLDNWQHYDYVYLWIHFATSAYWQWTRKDLKCPAKNLFSTFEKLIWNEDCRSHTSSLDGQSLFLGHKLLWNPQALVMVKKPFLGVTQLLWNVIILHLNALVNPEIVITQSKTTSHSRTKFQTSW